MKNLLNRPHNKYNKDTICIKSYEVSENQTLVFFSLNPLETTQESGCICPYYTIFRIKFKVKKDLNGE
jgi:hypothetical protein